MVRVLRLRLRMLNLCLIRRRRALMCLLLRLHRIGIRMLIRLRNRRLLRRVLPPDDHW